MGYTNKELQKNYAREHYLDHKDEYYWKCNLNRALNPERTRLNRKKYYEEHREHELTRKKEWVKNNPEKVKILSKKSWDRRKVYENPIRKFKRMLDKYEVV